MINISNKTFDAERALYGSDGLRLSGCAFDGPADGESALKESCDVHAERCFFNLRYPFWHDTGLEIIDSEMTPLCRAAIWYSHDVRIAGTKLHGIKALRECSEVALANCDIISPEFGWSVRGMTVNDTTAAGEYFVMRSERLLFRNVKLDGKYSFQYVENAVIENCELNTKDAFWHAKNVVLRNCAVKSEYLAWYCENVTLENCKIYGTQPFCYCKGLKLIDCEMYGCDLAFEKSDVEARISTPVDSIKNPRSGHIYVPAVGQSVTDDAEARGEIIIT